MVDLPLFLTAAVAMFCVVIGNEICSCRQLASQSSVALAARGIEHSVDVVRKEWADVDVS